MKSWTASLVLPLLVTIIMSSFAMSQWGLRPPITLREKYCELKHRCFTSYHDYYGQGAIQCITLYPNYRPFETK